MQHNDTIIVLDFGAQYSQLIARRVRDLGVYSELHPYTLSVERIREIAPKGIILSGGPASVYEKDAPLSDPAILDLGIPVLGICYGLQLIAYQLGGEVDRSAKREYGKADLQIDDETDLFADLSKISDVGYRMSDVRNEHSEYSAIDNPKSEIQPSDFPVHQKPNDRLGDNKTSLTVWMSHGDALTRIPPGFEPIAHSANSPICAIRNAAKKIYAVQFHPEVVHTVKGKEILSNFVFRICGCTGGWNAESIIGQAKREIRERVGKQNVICALSGGVDSSVLAVLLHEAIGDQLYCIHINNGLMRKDESEKVVQLYRDTYHFNLDYVDATELFLNNLKGVIDPEQKRKIIGNTFIEVFDSEAKKIGNVGFLAQGTLYPDVIESVSVKGPSHTIKSHHNVGGLPATMKLKLIEPFRELFKDEVRAVGRSLGLPEEFIIRHPFPGPGLGVRLLGEMTKERLDILREADAIFIEELRNAGLYETIWQAFVALLPVYTVGVMGDQRTYENVAALRAVHSLDGMTADWVHLPYDVLERVSGRIVNEVRGINRVVYDISSKPPSTIEWE